MVCSKSLASTCALKTKRKCSFSIVATVSYVKISLHVSKTISEQVAGQTRETGESMDIRMDAS